MGNGEVPHSPFITLPGPELPSVLIMAGRKDPPECLLLTLTPLTVGDPLHLSPTQIAMLPPQKLLLPGLELMSRLSIKDLLNHVVIGVTHTHLTMSTKSVGHWVDHTQFTTLLGLVLVLASTMANLNPRLNKH